MNRGIKDCQKPNQSELGSAAEDHDLAPDSGQAHLQRTSLSRQTPGVWTSRAPWTPLTRTQHPSGVSCTLPATHGALPWLSPHPWATPLQLSSLHPLVFALQERDITLQCLDTTHQHM